MYDYNSPMPDCVPEYYRAKAAKEERRYELQEERESTFRENQKKLDAAQAAGLPVLWLGGSENYEGCWNCPNADHCGPLNEEDDFDRAICRNPDCPVHKKTA